MKKLVALILTLMLVLSFATVSFAASTKGTAVAGTSKSKTATALNPSTWTSDITLSLPSAEEKLEPMWCSCWMVLLLLIPMQ